MLPRCLKQAALILSVLVAALPAAAENFEVLGTLTIKPDLCAELPNLVKTSWSGTADIVSGTGYHLDQALALSITSQEGHLFQGLITRNDYFDDPQNWVPAPFYGALIGCYRIRIATGQTVLFADLNEAADGMTGYIFSTDPLGSQPQSQLSPCMATFELALDAVY